MTVQPKHARRLLQSALSKDYQGNAFKRALRDAQRNIIKTTQGLKAAYNGIIGAISKGNEEMVDKAIDVANPERARYFAERIARTEKARAYMDGAMYPYAHDPDCASFKWKLLSRHPCDDICDLYPYRFVGGWTKAFFKMTVGIMQGKLPWLLKRRGAVIFLVFQSIWGGSDEAGNHDPFAGSDSASIFIFFHPKAQHICYNNSNIVKF